jgi:hypothetical protein
MTINHIVILKTYLFAASRFEAVTRELNRYKLTGGWQTW